MRLVTTIVFAAVRIGVCVCCDCAKKPDTESAEVGEAFGLVPIVAETGSTDREAETESEDENEGKGDSASTPSSNCLR